MNRFVCLSLLFAVIGCGGDKTNPGAPTPTTTTTIPPQTLYTITGIVSSAASGPLSNATVQVVDGRNAGLVSNTDGSGRYTLSGLTFAGFTIMASAPGHIPISRGGILQGGTFTTTSNFTLLPSALFSRGGSGNTVFDIPTYVTRIQIQADYAGFSSNFIVNIAGRLVVNELLGRTWGATHYDGTHLIAAGGTAVITNSSGVAWSFIEVR